MKYKMAKGWIYLANTGENNVSTEAIVVVSSSTCRNASRKPDPKCYQLDHQLVETRM